MKCKGGDSVNNNLFLWGGKGERIGRQKYLLHTFAEKNKQLNSNLDSLQVTDEKLLRDERIVVIRSRFRFIIGCNNIVNYL